MTARPPSSDRWTSHSMTSTPNSIADRNDVSVFSGHSSALPRWPPSKIRPLRSFAARPSACAIVTGQSYATLSRSLYIGGHAQEISKTAVTPATASARDGRLSHDLTQDPVAGAATAGAGAGDCAARALAGG